MIKTKQTVMKKTLLPLLFLLFSNLSFSQDYGAVSGKITDKLTNEALPGATVLIKGTVISAVTNNEGNFIIKKLNPGKIILEISYVGYETTEIGVTIIDGETKTANADLIQDERIGNAVVVSASKQREKITDAPASIQVIGIKELSQFAGSNVNELVSKMQGIEYTRNGVDEITFNARGFNSAFNIRVLQLVDGRNSMSAISGGLPTFNNGSTNKDDIERVEIVLGPQTALYGPNAHNALFSYITKDPRKYQGTTVSVSAGSQNQFSSRFRHATKINNKWAYKLSGEHATGKDYQWYDSVYAGNQPPPTWIGYRDQPPVGTTPHFGPKVAIPERIHDFTFRRYRGEAHVYYSVTPKMDIIVSSGGVNFTRLQVTTALRNQVRDAKFGFLQARLVHPHFFGNIYNTWSNHSNTILLGGYTRSYWNRTHSSIKDPNHPLFKTAGYLPPETAEEVALRDNTGKERSQRLNAEAQYNTKFENTNFENTGLSLVAGLSYQLERPNAFGITLVDSFQKIRITQYGAVVQLEKILPWSMRFISTIRFDHHSNFGNFFAPRFALVKAIADGALRITWGEAYSMPSILNQYAGINRFAFGNGGAGVKYIPTGAKYSEPASITYTTPLKPEQVNTLEAGYKGTIAKKLFVDVTAYYGTSKNFISPTITVPGRALAVNGIDVTQSQPSAGFVDNTDTLRRASFLTFFNYAAVKSWGVDIGINYTLNKFISAAIKYSSSGSDITEDDIKNDANKDGYVSLEEKSFNAPKNRGMVILSFQNLCKEKLFASISARWLPQYEFYSGTQIGTAAGKGSRGIVDGGPVNNGPEHRWYLKNFDWGPLGGFTTIDLSAGYKVNQMMQVNMGITNLFNTNQIEFVGSPSIGRLIMFELKVHVPNKK